MARGERPLVHREERAIHFFLLGHTQKDSLVKAGYSESTARGNPQSVFDRPVVAQELARRQLVIRKEYTLSEEWVIERLMRIADSGRTLARFKKVTEDGGLEWDFTGATEEELALISELTVAIFSDADGTVIKRPKVSTSDPLAALNSLARIQGMNKDKVQFEGELALVDRLARGRERARIIEHDPEEGSDG